MSAKNAQPTEITVYAKPDDVWATVCWEFSRMQIPHRFSLQMCTTPMLSPVRHEEFQMKIPTVKGSKGPRHVETTSKITDPTYKAMIDSIVLIVKKHDLILQAQTSPVGAARVRDPAFKFPTWRDRKVGYNPVPLREALLASTMFEVPKRAMKEYMADPLLAPKPNGQGELALPGPGKSDPMVSVIEIIEKNFPSITDPYVEGVHAVMAHIEQMRKAIASQMAEYEKQRNDQAVKVYAGYDKLLHSILDRGDVLLTERAKIPPVGTFVPELKLGL